MNTQGVEHGFLAHPDAPSPGVVMIHDVWGLSDHTRELAARLAGEGFAVLAVDLYRREDRVEIGDPGAWMRGLSDPQALADIGEAAAFLAGHPASRGRKVGVTGFCMGGMYALLAACEVPGLAASAAYYGLLSHEHGIPHAEEGLDPSRKPRQPLDAAADLACPLLAFFGDADEFVERVETAVAGLDAPDAGAKARQRLSEAENHTWRGRFERAQATLLDTLAAEGLA